MTGLLLPLVVEPETLEAHLADEDLLVIDLGPRDVYEDLHVPGAVHLDHRRLSSGEAPATGGLPDEDALAEVLTDIGLEPRHHVVAYDDEGGGWASRLLWILDVVGHRRHSLLNGGLCAWLTEGHPTEEDERAPGSPGAAFSCSRRAWVDKAELLARLGDPRVAIIDSRTPGEYAGRDVRAARGGHVPGAVNLDWQSTIDRARRLRLKPEPVLRETLEGLGVTPDKEVIVYCQTHHRSSHTYVMLKALGYPSVRAYPGSWAEWGNSPETPVVEGEEPGAGHSGVTAAA
jgi:thiosulfate/3-mercaptopyruvate sulfurtransferase